MGNACSGSKKKQKLNEEQPQEAPLQNPPQFQPPPPKPVIEQPVIQEKPKVLGKYLILIFLIFFFDRHQRQFRSCSF